MPDTRDNNKAVARQLMSAWNKNGVTHLPKALAHPQFVQHSPGQPGFAAALPGNAIVGQQFIEDMVIADDQYAFIAWHMTGVHQGPLYGRVATNAPVTVHGADVIRVADGKVIEHWDWYSKSRVQALGQLGLLDASMQSYLISNNLLGRNRRLS